MDDSVMNNRAVEELAKALGTILDSNNYALACKQQVHIDQRLGYIALITLIARKCEILLESLKCELWGRKTDMTEYVCSVRDDIALLDGQLERLRGIRETYPAE